MVRRVLILLTLAAAISPAAAFAGEPPNQNDPCSRGGRDSCNTTGVGQYRTYRYGLRWFGDYRGAIRDVEGPSFCLDLRYWYPGRAYDFRERSADELRNRDGDLVPSENLRRMSYAMWNFGRTKTRANQGAVMLYVHRMMGDGAPGEVDPAAGGPAVRATYARIARDAARYAGPYRIDLGLPDELSVRRRTTLRIRVVAISGRVVPNVRLALTATGASGLPSSVDTGADGIARPSFTPTDVKNGVSLRASAGRLAAPEPTIYVPARASAARNGQRLAVPASAPVSGTASAEVRPGQLNVTTAATPSTMLAGERNRDKVTIGGAYHGWRGTVEVRLYGPFRSQAAISCVGAATATTSYEAGGGPSLTPAIAPAAPGWYGYQLTIAGTIDVDGLTTPCGVPEESFKVEVRPDVGTQVNVQRALPGDAITDTVVVGGLAGETVTVAAALYGPYPSAAAITCAGTPVWAGDFVAAGDGTYVTTPVTLTVPGYYTYRESIPTSDFVRGVQTPCAAASETTIVGGNPRISTQVSAQESSPGSAITDQVGVSGLGALGGAVSVALYGPFPTREAIRCDVAPLAVSQLAVTGDGSYTSTPTTLTTAGYYTYQESIAATEAYAGVTTPCGDVAETTFARARPTVTTIVSSAVVRPGSAIFDRIRVSGLGRTPAQIEVRLYGPFASRAAMRCDGEPRWKDVVGVNGDGTVESDRVRVARAGFYTYRERIVETTTVAPLQTECGEEAETSLARPLILTGRGDPTPAIRATAPAGPALALGAALARRAAIDDPTGPRPTRVRLASRGVDAPVYSVDIDTRAEVGALAIPKDIDRVGWWRDGAAPGDARGTILLAGHIDSAKRGAGAFYALKSARRGDTIKVSSDDGKLRSYRVTTVRRVRKAALPGAIFTRSGPRRLVLVTCGGPFDQAIGHYRDNLIVTALPR